MSLVSRAELAWCIVLSLMTPIVGGCGVIASRQPIYDPNTQTILDDRLVGNWQAGNWSFRVVQWRCGYWISNILPGQSEESPGPIDLVRIGRYEFMFIASLPPAPPEHSLGTQLFPCYRVEFANFGKSLRLRFLNTVWLAEYLEDHPGVLKYEIPPNLNWPSVAGTRPTTQREVKNIELTDDPARIRRFFIDHANDPGFFSDVMELRRVRE